MNRFGKNQLESLAHTLFRPSGAAGVQARTALFEQLIEGLSGFITRHREPATEILSFPPVMSRAHLERSGYLHSFPHLLGCVSCLHGAESDVRALAGRADWVEGLSAIELVLSPAACYPLYPLMAARGPLPAQGVLFDVASWCFRREATHELDRMQAFRMREYVCMGTAEQVLDFRLRWLSRAQELARLLGLPHHVTPASDPFFGRAAAWRRSFQLQQSLKFEWLIPVLSEEQPTACMSFNYHRDHFGTTWNLRTATGETAHTGCVAFGMDRLTLALFAIHGLDPHTWPATVRESLSL